MFAPGRKKGKHGRAGVKFDRILTPKFTKDVEELKTYDVDIRKILTDDSITRRFRVEDLAPRLREHFEKHRLRRLYRTSRCPHCKLAVGFYLPAKGEQLRASLRCHCTLRGKCDESGPTTFENLADLLLDHARELDALLAFDMDMLDLEESDG